MLFMLFNSWYNNTECDDIYACWTYNPKQKILIDTLVLSGIAGITAGVGSWLFAKLDERKARKPPHQIQNPDRKLPTTTPGALVL